MRKLDAAISSMVHAFFKLFIAHFLRFLSLAATLAGCAAA
jgi:hypothetical protein